MVGMGWTTEESAQILAMAPPVQWTLWAASPVVKWLVCEVDHSPPESEK